ncbi:MAG: RNA polymerase factor sigma-54 [Victivallaceae bacterium]|nr:RNA polymerase factor sigma-54 [Victivallaceae bacterium]
MDTSLRQSESLRQTQQLSLRQRTALEVLQLPRLELEARIDEELAANPLLEELVPETSELPAEKEPAGETGDDDDFEEKMADSDEWHNDLPLPDEGDNDTDFWSGVAAAPPSLSEQLQRELSGANIPEKKRGLCEKIIDALDEKGYLATPLADVAMSCDADLAEAETALRFVQSLDPAGIAARDLGECFRLQLERRGQWSGAVKKLIENGLDDLERLSLPALGAKCGETVASMQAALGMLRQLDPAPGRTGSDAAAVFPDLRIFATETGGFDAQLLRERERKIGISERYRKLLDDPTLSADDRNFIREKVRAAGEWLKALEMRGSTLLRLGRWIAQKQEEFFRRGIEKLLPLTMKQAGEALEVHETTISRAVSGKYAATPRGVLPLRFFFSGGYQENETGATVSVRAIEEKIRKLVAEEDPAHPLSDDALANALQKEGIAIARRTVAKYRKALHIPPSSLRILR